MSGAWEDPLRIAELVESVNLQNIQSGTSTLISGAESGESVHIYEIVVEKENAMSVGLKQQEKAGKEAITLLVFGFILASSRRKN